MKCLLLNTFFLILFLWCVSASYTNIQDELINKWKSIGVQYCQTFPPLGPIPAKYPALMNLINQFASNISLLAIATGVPSVTVNLIYDQDILWSKGYGLKNHSNPKAGAPNGDTPYQIGSNSKLFTTLLALIAQDKGMLSFSDEVVTHVPEFEPNSPFPSKRSINFAQLASHMAGLPRESPCDAIHSKCNFTNDQMWARVQNVTLVNPPDFVPSYSNLGFAVLGHAVEEIWGTNWADLIQQEIFLPLGMINSGATLDENFWQNRAVGYTYQNAQASVVDLGWESPAGGIYSTANDMSKFVSFLFRDDVPYMAQPDQILDAMSIREWRQLRYINVDLTGYGMPWEIFNSPIIYTKAGSINGYVSLTITVPRLKLGLVILQSSDVAATLSDIFGLFLTYFVKSFAEILLEVAPAPYIPPNFNSFEGTYYFANNTVQIYQVQSSKNYTVPLINYSGLVLQLQYVSENVFKMSTQDVPLTCFYAQSGIEQYINLIPSSPPSFTIPGLAPGAVAVKVS